MSIWYNILEFINDFGRNFLTQQKYIYIIILFGLVSLVASLTLVNMYL